VLTLAGMCTSRETSTSFRASASTSLRCGTRMRRSRSRSTGQCAAYLKPAAARSGHDYRRALQRAEAVGQCRSVKPSSTLYEHEGMQHFTRLYMIAQVQCIALRRGSAAQSVTARVACCRLRVAWCVLHVAPCASAATRRTSTTSSTRSRGSSGSSTRAQSPRLKARRLSLTCCNTKAPQEACSRELGTVCLFCAMRTARWLHSR
jgi:hypothetical protein